MRWESLFCRSHFSLSLDVWSFAKVLMLDLACIKNIACLLGEKITLGGKNQIAHLKELVDQCQWGWRILSVTAKSQVSQGHLFEQFLTVHLSSQLPLEDSPSPPPAPLFYRSKHWGALRDPSCSYKFPWTAPTPGMLWVTTCCWEPRGRYLKDAA